MKHFSKCIKERLCLFLLALLFPFSTITAQDYRITRQNALNKLDLSGLNNALFLNAAVTSQNEVTYLKRIFYLKSLKPEPVSSEEWQNLYERLYDADLRPTNQKIPELTQLVEINPAKLTRNDTIPLGIIDLESVYLTEHELQENEKSKKSGQPANFASYEKFRIIYAAALQEELYQADAFFKISPKLLIANHHVKITGLDIDFGDGNGYSSYDMTEQLISHRFETTGKHPIKIRLKTSSRVYQFETYVNVLQLERIKPLMEFHISAPALVSDSTMSEKTARTNIVGATIRIVSGCDAILDKPVIIAEGFDMGNDNNLDALEAKFREPMNQWLREGFDLVFLNYDDGRAPIENNAQVMKEVIQHINNIKQGNIQTIVIGASMSGLVARYAIRKMEQDGITHNVRLMICYDTPHQGANMPVGVTQLLWDSNPTLLTNVILKFFAKGWRDYYNALLTPAATQMMLHWGGQLTGGVGSKAPAFNAFRTNLSNLGNGGYPQLSRNIAVIHGSMNAQDRAIFNDYNYGSRLLRSWTPFGLQNTNIDIHTNALDQNSNVIRFATWGIFFKRLGVTRSYNSPFNDDFLPGGRTTSPVPNKLFKNDVRIRILFCPNL
jgi:hypothetical protein